MVTPNEDPEQKPPFLTLITKWFTIIIWERPGVVLSALLAGLCVAALYIGATY